MAVEEVSNFGIIDYAVFCGVLLLSLCIGIYYACSGGRQRTAQEFLLGDRQMSWIPVAFSIFASFTSAIVLLSAPSEVYTYGSQYAFMIVAYFLLVPVTAYLYLPVYFKLGCTSVYEYLERRFSKAIRKIAAATFLFQTVMYLSVVIYAPSLALSHATGIHVWASAALVACICTVYTSIVLLTLLWCVATLLVDGNDAFRVEGGIKAVIWTDVFQTILTFIAMSIIAVKGCLDLGGFSHVWNTNQHGGRVEFFNTNFDPRIRQTVWTQSVGALFTWLSIFGISQTQVQRYMSMPSTRFARKALWATFVGLSANCVICTLVGFNIYARYKDCDPVQSKTITSNDQLLPLYAMEVLGILPGLPGLFVAGLLSGSLSTLSSGLNSMSAVILEDFVKATSYKNMTEERSATLAKVVAFLFGMVCLALVVLVENVQTLAQATLGLFGMIGGPMLGLYTLGMFCPFANSWGASVGVLVSLGFTCWIGFGGIFFKTATGKLPISIDGCIDNNVTVVNTLNISSLEMPVFESTIQQTIHSTILPVAPMYVGNTSVEFFYQIAFMWYSLIACIIVLAVGCLISCLTGINSYKEMDSRLFSPVILKCLGSSYNSNSANKQDWKEYNDDANRGHQETCSKHSYRREVQETQL